MLVWVKMLTVLLLLAGGAGEFDDLRVAGVVGDPCDGEASLLGGRAEGGVGEAALARGFLVIAQAIGQPRAQRSIRRRIRILTRAPGVLQRLQDPIEQLLHIGIEIGQRHLDLGGLHPLQHRRGSLRCRAVVAGRVISCRIAWADNIGGWGFNDCFRLPLGHVIARFSRRRVSGVGDDRLLMQIGQGGATCGIRIQDPGKGRDQVGASGAGDPRHQHMAAGTDIKVSPPSEAVNQHPCYTHRHL
ncbi:hypothetical protein [Streptomyces sp. NPDC001250]